MKNIPSDVSQVAIKDMAAKIELAFIAFKYSTERGLPIEIIREKINKHGLYLDEYLYNCLIKEHKEKSKKNSKFREEIF